MKIGVLALQGAFIEHIKMLNNLGIETFEIRQKKDIECNFDGLVLPGGESTVIGKLMKELEIMPSVLNLINQGLPVFGTCAGLLLLSKEISNDKRKYLSTLNVTSLRNAYGRQLGSFNTKEIFNNTLIDMTFIRAPYIEKVGKDVEILSVVKDKIVAVREKNQLATAFHPELTSDTTVHKYFIKMINESKF